MSSHHCISSVSAQRQSVVKHIRSYVFDDINQIIDIDVIDFEQYFKTVLYGKICTIVERVCVQHDIKSYNVNVSLKKFDCLGKILKKKTSQNNIDIQVLVIVTVLFYQILTYYLLDKNMKLLLI